MTIRVCYNYPLKVAGAVLAFGDKCEPLYSSLMTFIGVVEFISLRCFKWYWWCYNWSFDVSLGFFFLVPLSSLYFVKREERSKKKKTLESHQNSSYDTTGTIKKISTR